MSDFLGFIAAIGHELYDLWAYSRRPAQQLDPEYEMQLAMRVVRKAADERAKREIVGQ